MLDEEHERLPKDKHDTNSYILGRLSGHNVVIASLPEGSQGTVSAATVATHLARTFRDQVASAVGELEEECQARRTIFVLAMWL